MQFSFTLVGPHGESDVSIEAPEESTVGDALAALASLAGSGPNTTVRGDGRLLRADQPLGGRGIRAGSIVEVGARVTRSASKGSIVALHVVGGPNAGRLVGLDRGTRVIGRSPDCDIQLDDPDASRRHAELCSDAGGFLIRDLDSTNGTTIENAPVAEGPQRLPYGELVRIGSTTLSVLGQSEAPAATRTDGSGWVSVLRPPRVPQEEHRDPVEFPVLDRVSRPRSQWAAVVLATLAGLGLSLFMHTPQFLAFALLGPVAMLGSSLTERRAWRQISRRDRADFAEADQRAQTEYLARVAAETRADRHGCPDAVSLGLMASGPGFRLWERRRSDSDFLLVRLGLADARSTIVASRQGKSVDPAVAYSVPMAASMRAGPIGLAGPASTIRGVARFVLGQLLCLHSPRDVTVCALIGDDPDWRWLRWPPAVRGIATTAEQHAATVAELVSLIEDRRARRALGTGGWAGDWIVVLIDPARRAASLPGLRTVFEEGPAVGITAICVDDSARLLPPWCRSLAEVSGPNGCELTVRGMQRQPTGAVLSDRVSAGWADRLARDLAPLRDAGSDVETLIPHRVRLNELPGMPELTVDGLLDAWSDEVRAGAAVASIGIGAAGAIPVDLVRDGPHALIAGTTGSGKSELLRTLVVGLAAHNPPERIAFVLIDYKGGAAFAECADLPHTLGMVTDLDPHLTRRALISLDAELRRRETAFAGRGCADLADYWGAGRHPGRCADDAVGFDVRDAASPTVEVPIPRLVLVVDEFAALAEELPDFVSGLVGIAQRGRSLGVHLVLATQRPAGVVSPEIKANVALRIALRVTDPAESLDVIGCEDASHIGKNSPGRAVARLAGGLVTFQAAQVGLAGAADPAPVCVRLLDEWNRMPPESEDTDAKTELQLFRDAAREAAQRRKRPAAAAPWLAPLPDLISLDDLAVGDPDESFPTAIPVAVVDEPRWQRRTTLALDLGRAGAIGFLGGPRSGRTTALRTAVVAASRLLAPDALQFHIIDCAGGSLAGLSVLPHCGSAVTSADPSAVARFVERLEAEVRRRQHLLSEHRLGSHSEARLNGVHLPLIVVAVDGWEALASMSDDHDASRSADTLLMLFRDAAATGVTFLLSGDRGALAVRVSSTLSRSFLFEFGDRNDYPMAGVPRAAVPVHFVPGRAVTSDSADEVQFAVLGDDPSDAAQWRAVRATAAREGALAVGDASSHRIRVRPLPAVARRAQAETPDTGDRDFSGADVLLGVGGDSAEPVSVDVFAGDGGFLIAGPPRSGRTTASRIISESAHAAGIDLLVIAGRRSMLTQSAQARGVRVIPCEAGTVNASVDQVFAPSLPELIVIDDAERLTDTPLGDAVCALLQDARCAVVATSRAEDLHVSFRGICATIRRSQVGLLLNPGPADGDLLGVRVPSRRQLWQPGRGVLVTDNTRQRTGEGLPIQVYATDPIPRTQLPRSHLGQ
jgi:S-DNA-T family DNA segregation ATPase FtsK/SpoIIIE